MKENLLNFYKAQGDRTMVSENFVSQFPNDILGIVEHVQNILIHKVRVIREDELLDNTENHTLELKTNTQITKKIEGIDITQKIFLENKIVCICRNYAMLLVAILREKGFPARTRCGFGIYFGGGNYEDHWICEYWSKEQNR